MTKFWFDLDLIFRNLVRHKRRSGVAIGAVAFGLTALILASGFIQWILLDFRETSIHSQLGHLQIVRPGYHEAGKADPYAYLLPDTLPDFFSDYRQSDKTNAIVPRLSFNGLISHDDATLSFIGDAVSPKEQLIFGKGLQISTGSHLSDDEPSQIIAGEGLARNLGLSVGDQVVLLVNTTSGGINATEVTVGGLFTTVNQSYDEHAIRIPLETAQQLLRTNSVHSWVVLLNDTEDTNQVKTGLRNILSQDQYEIVPWYALSDFYNKTVVLFGKQIIGIKLILVLIILLSISNAMAINVIDRTGEIGTAMAIGLKRSGVIRLFLSEGILISCIGGIIGLIIGFSLADIISSIGIPMPPPPGIAHGYTAEILVTRKIAVESLILVMGTTLIACIYPAWKASRMQIVDALRHNR